ncbi:MAG: hypothetical protein LBR36_02085 [Bacteroidales bacterium]|nr:hypothetical protein [Bacteroidales bacterium]
MKEIISIFIVFIQRTLGKLQASSSNCSSLLCSFTKDAFAMQCVDYQAFTPPHQLPDYQAVTCI